MKNQTESFGPKYFGSKTIQATPKTLGEYNALIGWTIPGDEDPNREGYLVKYEDGYISWSPKEVFEAAYRLTDELTFGSAIEALKQGKRVQRKGWNGKGLFVFMQVPATIGCDIIPKMQSLPESVKKEFARRYEVLTDIGRKDEINYSNQLAIVNQDNLINGWAPSVSDALAEDWVILED